MMRIRSDYRAFTFLEVMIVVVILGVLAAMVVPNMRGPRERTALRTGARTLAAAGMLARQQAIVTGQATFLQINPETNQWRTVMFPPEREETWEEPPEWDDFEPQSSDEQTIDLPDQITFGAVRKNDEEQRLDEVHTLVYYPNGSCSGLAIMVANSREKSLTVDFEKGTGRPNVYEGDPKSFATKLRERGLNPADFGLVDDAFAEGSDSKPGEGFAVTAGWNQDERVDYYKDAVERMLQRGRNKAIEQQEGPGAAYRESSRW